MKKDRLPIKSLFALVCLSFSISIYAQKEIVLWPQGAPGSEGKTGEEKVMTAPSGIVSISNVHHPSITPYLPAKEKANGLAVIIAPGGGHTVLMMDYEGSNLAKWFNERGIAAFVLKYRLAKETGSTYTIDENELADMQRAVKVVRSRAKEWNIDTGRVGVLGFSAGGEVAGLAAMRFDNGNRGGADIIERQSSRPNFQVLVYPGGTARLEPAKNAPPLFIVGGFRDRADIAKGMALLYVKYKDMGIPAELHIYANAVHGFGVRDNTKGAVAGWTLRLYDWLNDMEFLKSK